MNQELQETNPHPELPARFFTQEQVIRIVAQFGRTYNTGAFMANGQTLEQAIEEVKGLIEWDV